MSNRQKSKGFDVNTLLGLYLDNCVFVDIHRYEIFPCLVMESSFLKLVQAF